MDFVIVKPVAEAGAGDFSVSGFRRQEFTVIADHRPVLCGFDQPFDNESFGEFTLRIFVGEDGPQLSRVEQPFQRAFVAGCSVDGRTVGEAAIEP